MTWLTPRAAEFLEDLEVNADMTLNELRTLTGYLKGLNDRADEGLVVDVVRNPYGLTAELYWPENWPVVPALIVRFEPGDTGEYEMMLG